MRYRNILKEARRSTEAEFIQMARKAMPTKVHNLSIADMNEIARENDVQIPTTIRGNPSYKAGPHHWNLSGKAAGVGDVDQEVARDTGVEVDPSAAPIPPEYGELNRLATAQQVSRLAAQGKVYLFGRKPKGAFFRIPGVEEYTAQLERMLARELESQGDSSMQEQYDVLMEKVELVAGGQSQFIKSLLITGMPSSGKTYNVMQAIHKLGLEEGEDYIVKKGRITVLSMYRTLIEQTNGLTIFDDCDSVVEDKNGINMLKGALDTDPVREISYDVRGTVNTAAMHPAQRDDYVDAVSKALRYKQTSEDVEFLKESLEHMGLLGKALKGAAKKSESMEDDSEEIEDDSTSDDEAELILNYCRTHLPNKIDFKGRVIFISNMDEDEWDSAILTRAIHQNMNFRSDEMLDFIDKIKSSIKTPGLNDEEKQEVMDYIRELWTTGRLKKAVNFRLIQQAFDMRLTPSWRKMIAML